MTSTPATPPALEALIRRERLIVAAGLVGLVVLSWIYIIVGAGTGMSTWAMTTWRFPPGLSAPGSTGPMMGMGTWTTGYWLLMFAMWWVMMIAMMIPSAAPAILLHARVYRHEQKKQQLPAGPVPTVFFVGGYLAAWVGFSLVATALQWALEQAGLVDGMLMWTSLAWFAGGLLIVAGLYQFSSLKQVCLKHCQSPAAFLAANWRAGRAGSFRLGLQHGLFCVGCCWGLMLLLFAGGIMNLVWIAGLAGLVLLEKLLPASRWFTTLTGAVLIASGVWVWAA